VREREKQTSSKYNNISGLADDRRLRSIDDEGGQGSEKRNEKQQVNLVRNMMTG
jgi:hypothetical protein